MGSTAEDLNRHINEDLDMNNILKTLLLAGSLALAFVNSASAQIFIPYAPWWDIPRNAPPPAGGWAYEHRSVATGPAHYTGRRIRHSHTTGDRW
jgi:hypothetical protein